MKKAGFFIFALIILMAMSSCSTIRSYPTGSFVYQTPIPARDTTTFTGSGLNYSAARNDAIKEAIKEGYTRIVAEYLEMNSITGFVDVTVIMIR
jgi:hypothetical protein